MADTPSTRASLLMRIRDGQDREAWRQFVDLYAPLIYDLGRRRGLQDADAADLTQEVLATLAKAVKGLDYDPRRGTFRGWLYTVAHNHLVNFLAKRGRQAQASGDSATQALLDEQPAREPDEAFWEREYQQRIFAWAAERVRGQVSENAWRAFWLVAVDGKSGEEVAQALGMSVGAVYVAKSRVLARLKQEIATLRED